MAFCRRGTARDSCRPRDLPDGQMLAAPAATMSAPSPHAIAIPRRPARGEDPAGHRSAESSSRLGLLEIVPEIDRRLIPVDWVLLEAAMHESRKRAEESPA